MTVPKTQTLRAPRLRRLALVICLLVGVAVPATAQDLTAVEERLEAGDGEGALELLRPLLGRRPRSGEALLARSTAHFLVGDLDAGEADLRQAVDLDPSLRQAWLNLGALAVSEGRPDEALSCFLRARELDPDAEDNGLNIGAAQLLLGHLAEAREEFQTYLDAVGGTAEAHRLVAQNFALANAVDDALRHTALAIGRDERLRLSIRTNPSFAGVLDDPRFAELLSQDLYRAPPGSLRAEHAIDLPYSPEDPRVVGAVVDALDALAIPFDPRIEASDRWALIWSDTLRIKIAADGPTASRVEILAPPRSHTRSQWESLRDRLFERLDYEVTPRLPGGG